MSQDWGSGKLGQAVMRSGLSRRHALEGGRVGPRCIQGHTLVLIIYITQNREDSGTTVTPRLMPVL